MRAVIFDLGHTLIDYYNDWRVPEKRAVSELWSIASRNMEDHPEKNEFVRVTLEELDKARIRRRTEMIEIPLADFLQERLSDFGIHPSNGLIEEGMEVFYRALLEHRSLIPGSKEMLKELEEKGYLIGLISDVAWGLPSSYPLRDMEHYELVGYFDDMVFSTDVGLRKPNRKIFEIAMEHLGVVPEESVYVGNNLQADIAGALGAGMKAILKRSNYFSPDDAIVPSAKVDGWSELWPIIQGL